MKWDDLVDRLKDAGLQPIEEIYMEHYGNFLAAQRQEFHGRYFRCTYGAVSCAGLRVEAFLFPSIGHLQEFMEIVGGDPWYIAVENAVIHFPVSDPEAVDNIVRAVTTAPG